MSIFNILYNIKFLKKRRQKRCKDCIHAIRFGKIFACKCFKGKYIGCIQPLKIICFDKKISKDLEDR